MYYMGKRSKHPIPPCPRCGMFSGERVTDGKLYFCRCNTCGYITKGCANEASAGRQWKAGK